MVCKAINNLLFIYLLVFFSSVGPPGTGKTTVISAAAKTWAQANEPVWIIAHSNVAVKNIAEKLLKDSVDFKLLVSKDFYKEWCL